MATFFVGKDYETMEHAGASGMFQINGLTMDNGEDEIDVYDKIDPGMQFHEEVPDELVDYLAEKFNLSKDEIDIQEV